MNTYKAFYKGKTVCVQAETSYSAQKIAAEKFKAKKQYEVLVVIIEKDGQSVHHSTSEL